VSFPGTIRFSVRISPGSSLAGVRGRLEDGSVKVNLRSRPVDGKANSELIAFLAGEFGTNRESVRIITGRRSRLKLVQIDHPGRIPRWLGSSLA
jgi:uncharacterized protein (TIGR00251 family)